MASSTPSTTSAAPCDVCFDRPDDGWLPRIAPIALGIDGSQLAPLVDKAKQTRSDHMLLVTAQGVVLERHWGDDIPIETQSLTKSVVALGILALIADGEISSLDEPLHTYFPEMAHDGRRAITLRHVLSHSSGLDASDGINDADDRLAYARALKLERTPGTRFQYNNAACQLLAGVIADAAGISLDRYLSRRILAPLGIVDAHWSRDRSGGIQAYFGLELRSRDLVKLGLLLLQEGNWKQRQLLPQHLVVEATKPSATSLSYGLLFWRRTQLRQTKAALERWPFLAPLAGKTFRTEDDYFRTLRRHAPKDAVHGLVLAHPLTTSVLEERRDQDTAFLAVGGLGQRLVVYPQRGLVAVRQHRRHPRDEGHERLIHWRQFESELESALRR